MAHRPHRVVILGFPPAQMLDIAGPLEVLSLANSMARSEGAPLPYEISLGAPAAGPLATTSGVPLVASFSVFDTKVKADTLLLSGGAGARACVSDDRLVAALTAWCKRVPRVASICTGAFPLAATRLLDGRRATTHWAHFDEFAGQFPQVEIDRDALYVSDGKYHSSAGISAGIDYALALVQEDLGRAVALNVARGLVVFLKRPGGQSQFSAQLAAEAGADDPDRFSELVRWMSSRLSRDLSVDVLAERMCMSPRNFARRFADAMKVTPAKYVQTLRIDAARRLLTDGKWPIAKVADRCGFASPEAMRVAFQRHLAVAPSEFRARFQSAGRGLSGS